MSKPQVRSVWLNVSGTGVSMEQRKELRVDFDDNYHAAVSIMPPFGVMELSRALRQMAGFIELRERDNAPPLPR